MIFILHIKDPFSNNYNPNTSYTTWGNLYTNSDLETS